MKPATVSVVCYSNWTITESEIVLNWITDFLSDRSQDVAYYLKENCQLGHMSFMELYTALYINDLPHRVISTVWMFADDRLVYREISDEHNNTR